jgi:hypothetical protein
MIDRFHIERLQAALPRNERQAFDGVLRGVREFDEVAAELIKRLALRVNEAEGRAEQW